MERILSAGVGVLAEIPGEVLMHRAAAGDRAAYAEVVGRYGDQIRRVSYLLMHSSTAAEDVTQETFTRGLAAIDAYRGGADPSHWFCAIAINLCRQEFRSRKRHADRATTRILESGRRVRFTPRGILTSLVRREVRCQLTVAMGFLTQGQRETFVLHYVEELPYETIGSLLGISAGAARALSHRAREILRERMGTAAPEGV